MLPVPLGYLFSYLMKTESVNGLLLSLKTLKELMTIRYTHLMIHCKYWDRVIHDHKVDIR